MDKAVTINHQSASYAIASKVKDYFILIKFTLSFMVVFSCVVCYLLAPNVKFDFISVVLLFIAGMLITGSANAINQIVERDTDAMMNRTATRPVASGRMSVNEAWTFATITGLAGIIMMWQFFNFASAMIGLFSLFLYAFIYTPLKKVNSISVLVGAFPGALPCLIGWVAATGFIDPFAQFQGTSATGEIHTFYNYGGYILFAIQFLWQFPHFWAIAWIAHRDYQKAGFKLLPSNEGPTKFTAIQTVIYSMLMVPIGMLPYYFDISGFIAFFILLFCNLWMVYVSIMLVIKMDVKAARKVMFSSYFYLMIVFLALLFDKI
ncbi:MAG: protoheme IX farnesyltransferase [Bacteroidota bacterium]|nr:protoheme IX farnesyltransferase [Bacteroidota bacterium]